VTIYFFEGPAGSGKTTALIRHLKTYLSINPLLDSQSILALTMMHGARRRLSEKLYAENVLRGKFVCSTFDSFAWRIVNRWKSMLLHLGYDFPQTYETTCIIASELLSINVIRDWVSRTYPLLIIDEAQDCKRGRLGILKALSLSCTVFVAADEFQDLYDTEQSEPVSWLQSVSVSTSFSENHRTSVQGLLSAANSLRNGGGIRESKDCIIKEVATHHQAAHISAYYLLNNKRRCMAILSPTKPSNSSFVHDTIEVLTSGELRLRRNRNPTPLKPFPIQWESDVSDLEQKIKQEIDIPEDDSLELDIDQLKLSSSTVGVSQLQSWIKRQKQLTGTSRLSVKDITNQITTISRQLRLYNINRSSKIPAMTIYQAKNQEFDCVIIFWPYQVGTKEELNRRLLYNAITRARISCLILVQGTNKRSRLDKPPFNMKQ
jgi:hypothetical protein